MPTLDFGFNANPTDSGTEPVTDLDTGVTGTVGSDGNIIPPIDEPNNDGQDNNGKPDGDGKKDDVDNPAANAKGTVNPSLMPITISFNMSEPCK